MQDAQGTQKKHDDSHCKARQFVIGDQVMVRNYAGTPRWLPGQVTSILGPVSYQVSLTDGRSWRRHQDQLLKATQTFDTRSEIDTDFDFCTSDDETSDSTTTTP